MIRKAPVLAATILVLVVSGNEALGHEGNPNFRSTVKAVQPSVDGLRVSVLNFDDRLQLVNRSERTVVIEGYDEEPYLRFASDGSVSVNDRSPARYLNEDRFAQVEVSDRADPKARPDWRVVSRNGTLDWHDHRVHWMAKSTPPQVKDEEKRAKVFDWRVPITVAGRPGQLRGELEWVPLPGGGGMPVGAIVALVGVGLASLAFVVWVRRRRRRAVPADTTEAW